MHAMSIMKTISTVVVGLAVTQSAHASFGLKVNERVFNDFPNSTLVTTTGPNSVQFDEGPFGTGGWANRHDVMATSDGGLTDHLFQISEPFSVEANVTLDPTDANAEAGLRLNASITGDVIFLIKNNGEIAAFGGGAPFFSFASPGDPDAYVPGTPIFMKMVYTPGPGLFQPGSVEYIIDRGNGLESSGVLAWQNLEGGPTNHTVGMYTQYSPTAPETTSHVVTTFNDIVITPEPASLALMGLGGLAALRRKR